MKPQGNFIFADTEFLSNDLFHFVFSFTHRRPLSLVVIKTI